MLLNHICSRFKAIILGCLTIFNRALCCFSRKRRNSFSDCEVLQSVNVVNHENYSAKKRSETDRDWNSWDDSPRTVDEHIEQYRQKLVQAPANEKQEPAIDFFQDMTPKIIRQTKVLLKTDTGEQTNFSRLQANTNNIPNVGAELEDWTDDDDQPAGWEELNDEHTKNLIREKRREQRALRHQKQQKQKLSKPPQAVLIAEKLGTKQS